MIRVLDEEYGTAAELAAVLGRDVTPAMIRRCTQQPGCGRCKDAPPAGFTCNECGARNDRF